MGEGEVCVAVVSNVKEMENEKIQQKRDHQWLTDGSDLEPLAKKQAKEGSIDEEVDLCANDQSEMPLVSIEQEPCATSLPTEGSDCITLEPSVEQNIKECSDGLELTEAFNDNIPDTQQCLKATEHNNETKQETNSLNYVGLNPSVEQPVKEGSDDMELDPCGEKQLTEVLNDMEIEHIVDQPVVECLNDMELEPRGMIQRTGAESDNVVESSIVQHVEESLIEMEPEACDKMQPSGALNQSVPEPFIEQPAEESPTAIEPTEALNQSEPEPSIEQPLKESASELELEACEPLEALNQSEPEPSIEQPVKESPIVMESEACDKMQSTEVLNQTEPEPFVVQHVKESPSEMETEACGKMQLSEALNETEPEPSFQQHVQESLNETELEVSNKMQPTEPLNLSEPEPFIEQPVKESSIEMGPEDCDKMQPTEALDLSEPEPNIEQPVKESQFEMQTDASDKMQLTEALNETEPGPSVQPPVEEHPSEMEIEACDKMQPTEALNETKPDVSIQQPVKESLNDTESDLPVDQSVKECQNEITTDPSIKKEASNDDICSEVSNPNISPRDNSSSFQTVNSQSDEKLVPKDQVVCGEITSNCSRNSSSEGSSSQEDNVTNDTSATVSTSHVILQVPKHASTSTGIRKITFKFSKRKEDYDSPLPDSAAKSVSNDNGARKVPRLTHNHEQGLNEPNASLLYPTNMEMTPGKVVPESYPTTVKRLLSTGILDGAKVKYISSAGELIGIVKDCGYLCGCAACNFSNILRAHEFEEHAGGKTRHPNNHIYLENGKPIYSIIQAMKTAPLSTVDEAIKSVAGSSVNEELLQVWKGSLQRNIDRAKTDNNYHMKLMNLYHSTTSQTREDGSSPYYCQRKSYALEPQPFVNETAKERKCLFKKPRAHTSSTAVESKRTSEGGHKKRDNDLHRLLFMPNGLPDGTELAYYARGKKILDGYKQGNGIVCSHCDTEISPSQFEAHAGWAAKRQPYRHIYIPNGLTLHDIALLLANGQSIATSNSDDMCAVCGDRGELVICDGCPRAFHAVCLELEGVPPEDWHCPFCRETIGSGRKTAAESRPIVIRLTRVVKAREYETGGCVICRAHDFSVAEFDDRTVMLCDQCEKEYHVGCLRETGRCDLKALPSDKWFCCDHCDMIHGAIQDVVVNGSSMISTSVLSIINKKHIDKGVFSGAPNEIRWRMLSGKSRYPEHLPLLSRAAAIFRECFDPIVAKSGRDLIPVMVYGRNISGQEFGGIYCVVLTVGSVVVSAGLLRIFGREVAELPLVATSRQHQGKGYFQALFFCIEELLFSLGVKLLVLPAAEEAESIWTKKLGFKKMSDERYTDYSRDIQLTIFKGTSMLEKQLCRATL